MSLGCLASSVSLIFLLCSVTFHLFITTLKADLKSGTLSGPKENSSEGETTSEDGRAAITHPCLLSRSITPSLEQLLPQPTKDRV